MNSFMNLKERENGNQAFLDNYSELPGSPPVAKKSLNKAFTNNKNLNDSAVSDHSRRNIPGILNQSNNSKLLNDMNSKSTDFPRERNRSNENSYKEPIFPSNAEFSKNIDTNIDDQFEYIKTRQYSSKKNMNNLFEYFNSICVITNAAMVSSRKTVSNAVIVASNAAKYVQDEITAVNTRDSLLSPTRNSNNNNNHQPHDDNNNTTNNTTNHSIFPPISFTSYPSGTRLTNFFQPPQSTTTTLPMEGNESTTTTGNHGVSILEMIQNTDDIVASPLYVRFDDCSVVFHTREGNSPVSTNDLNPNDPSCSNHSHNLHSKSDHSNHPNHSNRQSHDYNSHSYHSHRNHHKHTYKHANCTTSNHAKKSVNHSHKEENKENNDESSSSDESDGKNSSCDSFGGPLDHDDEFNLPFTYHPPQVSSFIRSSQSNMEKDAQNHDNNNHTNNNENNNNNNNNSKNIKSTLKQEQPHNNSVVDKKKKKKEVSFSLPSDSTNTTSNVTTSATGSARTTITNTTTNFASSTTNFANSTTAFSDPTTALTTVGSRGIRAKTNSGTVQSMKPYPPYLPHNTTTTTTNTTGNTNGTTNTTTQQPISLLLPLYDNNPPSPPPLWDEVFDHYWGADHVLFTPSRWGQRDGFYDTKEDSRVSLEKNLLDF